MTENVTNTHSQYDKMEPRWSLIDTALEGKAAIVAGGETYLPRPPGRTDAEYTFYSDRAVFFNVTAKTKEGIEGGIFRKKPIIELSEGLSYLTENADGEGTPLIDLAKDTTGGVIAHGRYGLLVEYPTLPESVRNLAEERELGLRAYLKPYSAPNIVDWRTRMINNEVRLAFVKLKETFFEKNDFFTDSAIPQYRILYLDQSNEYVQETYRETVVKGVEGAETKEFIKIDKESVKPRLPGGKALDYIPFQFIGSTSLNANIDKPPLYDLASVNMAHYINSADHEEVLYYAGQPMFYISGLDEDFIAENRGQFQVGVRTAMLLPEDVNIGYATIDSKAQPILEGMRHKEAQMLSIGARLIQNNQNTGSESEASVKLRSSGDDNLMSRISSNVSEGFTRALTWAAAWMQTSTTSLQFRLSKDFFAHRLSPNDQKELLASWMGGVIPVDVLWDNYRRGEIIDETTTDAELEALLAAAKVQPAPVEEATPPESSVE